MSRGAPRPIRRPVPAPTVSRLSTYRSALARLAGTKQTSVSSAELATTVGVNPATLRRDLSRLGTYGVRGTGYDVHDLLGQIDHALGLDRSWPVAIVGVGSLGHALARSHNFNSGGFVVLGLFDVAPAVVGEVVGGVVVEHLESLAGVVARRGIELGVITTPPGSAQAVAERLVEAGVGALLNFAPTVLRVPGAIVRQVDLAGELQTLTYYGARERGRAAGPTRRATGPGLTGVQRRAAH